MKQIKPASKIFFLVPVFVFSLFFISSDLFAAISEVRVTGFFDKFTPKKSTVVLEATLQENLQKAMSLIMGSDERSGNPQYEAFYKEVAKKYTGIDLLAFKTLHLKYLYFFDREKEFLNLLNDFPQDYVFGTYLKTTSGDMTYLMPLDDSKNFSKNGLRGLWDQIHEVDAKVKNAKTFSELKALVFSRSIIFGVETIYNRFRSSGDYFWGTMKLRRMELSMVDRPVIPIIDHKEGKLLDALVEAFNKEQTDENLVVIIFSEQLQGLLKKVNPVTLEAPKYRDFFDKVKKIKKRSIALHLIPVRMGSPEEQPTAVNFSYLKTAEDLTALYSELSDAEIKTFEEQKSEELEIYSLSENYIFLRITSPSADADIYLVFRKTKQMIWEPVIYFRDYSKAC